MLNWFIFLLSVIIVVWEKNHAEIQELNKCYAVALPICFLCFGKGGIPTQLYRKYWMEKNVLVYQYICLIVQAKHTLVSVLIAAKLYCTTVPFHACRCVATVCPTHVYHWDTGMDVGGTYALIYTRYHCPVHVYHWYTGTDMGCTYVLIYTRVTAVCPTGTDMGCTYVLINIHVLLLSVSSMCTTGTDMGCTYVLIYTLVTAVCPIHMYH